MAVLPVDDDDDAPRSPRTGSDEAGSCEVEATGCAGLSVLLPPSSSAMASAHGRKAIVNQKEIAVQVQRQDHETATRSLHLKPGRMSAQVSHFSFHCLHYLELALAAASAWRSAAALAVGRACRLSLYDEAAVQDPGAHVERWAARAEVAAA